MENSNSTMSWNEFLQRYVSFGEEIFFEYDNYKVWLSRGDDFYLTKYQIFATLNDALQEFSYKSKSLNQLLEDFFKQENAKSKLTISDADGNSENKSSLPEEDEVSAIKNIISNLNTREYVLFEMGDYEFIANKTEDGLRLSITYVYKNQQELLEKARVNNKTIEEIWQNNPK